MSATEPAPVWYANAAQRCEACGEPAEAGAAHCPACGARLADEAGQAAEDLPTAGFDCRSCGAQVACRPGLSSITCPFCDSTYVVELPTQDRPRVEPEFVVPFTVQQEQATATFREWLGGGLFTPGDLRAKARTEAVRGVYVPFWTFSQRAHSRWSASIGEYWYETKVETYTDAQGKTRTRTRTVRHTEWHPLSGRHHAWHFHDLVTASRGLPQAEADAVGPFDLAAMQRYRPEFLAGWLAEQVSLPREQALEVSQQRALEAEGRRIAAFLPGDTYRGLEWQTSYSQVSEDLVLLPFWIVAYAYEDEVHRFVLNGATGKHTGSRPMSGWRIAVAILVVAAVVGGLIAGALLAGGKL